jgi:hypothetical protein
MWSNMYRLVWFLQQSYVKPVRRRERHLTPPDTLLCTIILLLTRCWRTRASAVVDLQQTPVPWLLRPGRAEKSLTRQSADGQSAGVEESEICGTARVRRDLITFASFAHRHPVSSCWTISMSSTCTTIRCPSMAVSHSHQCRHAQTQMAYSYTAMSSSAWLYRSTYSTTHSTVTVAAAAVKQLGPTGVALAKVCAERYCYATMQRPALFSESRVQAIQKFQSRGSPPLPPFQEGENSHWSNSVAIPAAAAFTPLRPGGGWVRGRHELQWIPPPGNLSAWTRAKRAYGMQLARSRSACLSGGGATC